MTFLARSAWVLALCWPVSLLGSWEADPQIVTPENQQALELFIYANSTGCAKSEEVFFEIQHSPLRMKRPALAAELTLEIPGQSSTLLLHQKSLGERLLVTNLCLTPGLLRNARLLLVYGGHGSAANLLIDDFTLWPVEQE